MMRNRYKHQFLAKTSQLIYRQGIPVHMLSTVADVSLSQFSKTKAISLKHTKDNEPGFLLFTLQFFSDKIMTGTTLHFQDNDLFPTRLQRISLLQTFNTFCSTTTYPGYKILFLLYCKSRYTSSFLQLVVLDCRLVCLPSSTENN